VATNDEGTTTTPHDLDVIARMKHLRADPSGAAAAEHRRRAPAEHHEYIRAHGEDMPEIRNWR